MSHKYGLMFWRGSLALPKLGVGWMFALLRPVNFNRITIFELNVVAGGVSSMPAMEAGLTA